MYTNTTILSPLILLFCSSWQFNHSSKEFNVLFFSLHIQIYSSACQNKWYITHHAAEILHEFKTNPNDTGKKHLTKHVWNPCDLVGYLDTIISMRTCCESSPSPWIDCILHPLAQCLPDTSSLFPLMSSVAPAAFSPANVNSNNNFFQSLGTA